MAILAIALGISFWIAKRQSSEIQQLHSRLREQFAEVTIDDANRNKLHALPVPTQQWLLWKWHLFVPAGRQFRLNIDTGKLSEFGSASNPEDTIDPHHPLYADIPSGEYDFTLSLIRDKEHHDKWKVFGRVERIQMMGMPTAELQAVLNAADYDSVSGSRGNETMIAEPEQDLELLRYRVFAKSAGAAVDTSGPGDGILVWVNEVPPSKNPQ